MAIEEDRREDPFMANFFVVFFLTKNVYILCTTLALIVEIVVRLAVVIIGVFLNYYTFYDERHTLESKTLSLVAIVCLFGSFTLTCCKLCTCAHDRKNMELGVRIYEFFFSLIGGLMMLMYGVYYLVTVKTPAESSDDRIRMIGNYGVFCGLAHIALAWIQCLAFLKFKKREPRTTTTEL